MKFGNCLLLTLLTACFGSIIEDHDVCNIYSREFEFDFDDERAQFEFTALCGIGKYIVVTMMYNLFSLTESLLVKHPEAINYRMFKDVVEYGNEYLLRMVLRYQPYIKLDTVLFSVVNRSDLVGLQSVQNDD